MPVAQAAGKRVVAFREMVGAVGGFADPDLGCAAVEADLLGQLVRVDPGGAGLVHEVLHGDQRVTGLLGPAPPDIRVGGVDDSLQFAQRVRAAQLVFGVDVSVIRCPRVVHRNTCEPAQDPGAVDALPAALRVAGEQRVAVGAGAMHPVQGTGDPQPGLIEPGDLGIGDRIATVSRNTSSSSAARSEIAATVPSETGVPNSSASAWAVRALDRNCPTYRYRMIAVICGPYCTRAATPPGAVALVVAPHPQRRAISWCSVTCTRIGGRSNTCRRSMPTCGACASSAPQRAHEPGSWRSVSSGSSTSCSVDPGCPGWPPGRRPLRRRNDFGADLVNGESDDGGLDEFCEFIPSCRLNSASSDRNCSTTARSCAFSAASCSYDGRESAGTPP